MKTFWPSELIFRFSCANKPVSNLLVFVVLLSKLKNNFSIGPLITNMNGEIRITQEMMLMAIESAISDYPMDYSSTLGDCLGIKIVVETINELRTRIERGREFYPEKANELQELVQKSENKKYKGEIVVYKPPFKNGLIDVKMKKV